MYYKEQQLSKQHDAYYYFLFLVLNKIDVMQGILKIDIIDNMITYIGECVNVGEVDDGDGERLWKIPCNS